MMDGWIDSGSIYPSTHLTLMTSLPSHLHYNRALAAHSAGKSWAPCASATETALLFICSADTLSGENYTAGGAGGWGSAAGSRVQPVHRGPRRNAGVLTQLPPQTFGRRYRRARQYLCYRDTPERHLHTHTHIRVTDTDTPSLSAA